MWLRLFHCVWDLGVNCMCNYWCMWSLLLLSLWQNIHTSSTGVCEEFVCSVYHHLTAIIIVSKRAKGQKGERLVVLFADGA